MRLELRNPAMRRGIYAAERKIRRAAGKLGASCLEDALYKYGIEEYWLKGRYSGEESRSKRSCIGYETLLDEVVVDVCAPEG